MDPRAGLDEAAKKKKIPAPAGKRSPYPFTILTQLFQIGAVSELN
jgi:hypothetical protein